MKSVTKIALAVLLAGTTTVSAHVTGFNANGPALDRSHPVENLIQVAAEWESAWINDPDGYTNIREGRGTNTAIIGRVYEGQEFSVVFQSDSDWWHAMYTDHNGEIVQGFIHRSRVHLGQ